MKAGFHTRTPEILQMESVECGAAALGMVLGYYGRHVPLAELRRDCGVSREGSKASHMLQAARKHGLKATGIRCEIDALENLPLPAILFWEFNHFVVLDGWNSHRRAYFINDPAGGHRRLSAEEFSSSFTGVALRMEPGEDFLPRPCSPGLVKTVHGMIFGEPRLWIFVLCCAFLLMLPPVVTAGLVRVFLDEFLIGGEARWLTPILAGLLGCILVQWLSTTLQGSTLRRWIAHHSKRDANRMLERVFLAPLPWHANRSFEDIAGRSMTPFDSSRLFAMNLAPAALNLLPLGACVAMMAFWDPGLAGLAVLLVVGASLLGFLHHKAHADDNRQLSHLRGRLDSTAIHGLSVIEHLKCGGGSGFLNRIHDLQVRIRNLYQDMEVAREVVDLRTMLLAACGLVILFAWGSHQILELDITIGMLGGFFVLWLQILVFLRPWLALPESLGALQRNSARLNDVPPLESLPHLKIHHFQRLEIRNVTFGYSVFRKPVIQALSLRIHPGQIVALTGASGSGKSTVVKLIQGVLTPWSGEVLLNNQRVTPSALAACAGVVEQEIFFFNDSVTNNLRLGNPHADLEGPIRAAGLKAVLANREEEPLTGNGANFSGGQRQRLEIARILARNAGLFLLDESLSGLDADGAESILEEFCNRGCAVFLVTHRPELMRRADEILVLESGRIVERGSFGELSKHGPVFQSLLRPC